MFELMTIDTTYFTSLIFIFPAEPVTPRPGLVAVIPYTLSGLPASVRPCLALEVLTVEP